MKMKYLKQNISSPKLATATVLGIVLVLIAAFDFNREVRGLFSF